MRAATTALGLWHLKRGEFGRAEEHFRLAIARLTERNPNPRDGEPYYNLGLALRYLDRDDEAYAAFYKAAWSQAWQSPAYHGLAEIDCCRNDWRAALDHLDRSLRTNTDNLRARDLRVMVLRKLERYMEASVQLRATLELDPLDGWARHLLGRNRPATPKPATTWPSISSARVFSPRLYFCLRKRTASLLPEAWP